MEPPNQPATGLSNKVAGGPTKGTDKRRVAPDLVGLLGG